MKVHLAREETGYAACGQDGWAIQTTGNPAEVTCAKCAPASLRRHADHDPAVPCRPAGNGLCEPYPAGQRKPPQTQAENEKTPRTPARGRNRSVPGLDATT